LPFGVVPGSLSDLLGLRLSLPRSRPAQISEGARNSAKPLQHCQGNIAKVSKPPHLRAKGQQKRIALYPNRFVNDERGARVESTVLKGLNHITLSVSDLARSVAYYTELLGFSLRARWNRGAYLALGELWLCLSHDAHVREGPLAEYTHFALSVDPADFDVFSRKVAEGAHPIWREDTSEGESIYLLDPDGHKLEVHAGSLESRLATLRKEPYDGLVLYHEERNAHD